MASVFYRQLSISDMEFQPVNDSVTELIYERRKSQNSKKMKRYFCISSTVFCIICILELIGRITSKRYDSLVEMFVFLIIAYIILVALYTGYIRLENTIYLNSSDLSFLYGSVSDKYSAGKLSAENRTKSENYVLFNSKNIHCTTAIPIKDTDLFNSLNINDEIIIVKNCVQGHTCYEIIKNVHFFSN